MNKKEFYDSKVKEYSLVDKEADLRYRRAIELAKLKNKSSLLDIGCKFALLRDLIGEERMEIEYYGTDISEEVIKKIRDFSASKFKVGDVSDKIPFESDSFDFVFALEIMEHVEKPTQMLKEIHRVLKKGGILILSVPNVYCWNEIICNMKKKPDTEGHISAFTYQIMEKLLYFNNFTILNYCGTYMRIPFSKKFLKNRYLLYKTNNIFLTRSFIYKIQAK